MRKAFLISILFILLVSSLIYTTNHSNKRINEFLKLQKNIAYLISTNKNFDIFMSSSISYNNFDYVQSDVRKIKEVINNINKKDYFVKLELDELKNEYKEITKLIYKKIDYLEKLKSYSAVLNNSYRYIQKITQNINKKDFTNIYTKIIGLEFNSEIDLTKLKTQINNLENLSSNEKLFKLHANNIIHYYEKFILKKEEIKNIGLLKKLDSFEVKYNEFSNVIIKDIELMLWIVISVLSLSIFMLLFYYTKIAYQKIQLNRFKQAVESSDNIIMTTDENQRIKYVNENFLKSTGYTYLDVIGKKASILKSGLNSKDFYDNLNKTIYKGKRWFGEFINRSKEGDLIYEKASITPIFNEKGKIIEFLAIKLDITKEKNTQKALKQKEYLLAQQSKMVAMHEMLDSIAHQWRQPLSAISTAASGMKLNKEFGNLDDETFDCLSNVIVENTLYLSNTIDNFKNFFKTNHEYTLFNIKDTINKVLDLVAYKLNDSKIEVVTNLKEFNIEGLEHELIQTIVNILNNAQDAIDEKLKADEKRYIFIDTFQKGQNVIISIKDNAKGLNLSVIEHVFEPYFTTKHQSQGTGIGLYMAYEVISKHFQGIIEIENKEYTYDNIAYKGANINIKIPIKRND